MVDYLKLFFCEMLGTWLLLMVILFTIKTTKKDFFKGDAWIKIGLGLAVAIAIFGSISGGNFNPAVSLSLYLNGDLPLENLGVYVVAQCIGGVLAVVMYKYYKDELGDLPV